MQETVSVEAYQDHVCSVAESIKVDQLFDLSRQPKQSRVHDVGQEPSQGLHVIARLGGRVEPHPLVFCSLDEVVDFGVDDFENALLGGFLIISELLSGL